MSRFLKTLAVLLSLAVAGTIVHAHASPGAGPIGVVLLHGKGADPSQTSALGQLADWLTNNGFLVATPEMPWSAARHGGAAIDAAMQEIDAAIESLRAMGAERIVVGGHSLGADAALAYGAHRDGLAGIMALAPAHRADVPDNAAHLKAQLLWVVGKQDPMAGRGKAYAFARAPKHPKNAYRVVARGHFDTPVVAEDVIEAWLKGL